jgi:histo-blood group ABO system transferase
MKRSLFLLSFFLISSLCAEKIGLLVMATYKYTHFIPPLIESARKHFCKNHTVTFFVFTDGEIPQSADVVQIYQPRLGWPFDTMMRFEVYAKHSALLASQDYLYACDADMLFVDTVGDEILGERVATLHPGFVGMRGSYERNPLSLAYTSPDEGKFYFCGGFLGGKAEEVLTIAKTVSERIQDDLNRGVIAEWHDEAHWNRYCIDHEPTLVLTPSYCYPEELSLDYHKRLLALCKNHKDWQQPLE